MCTRTIELVSVQLTVAFACMVTVPSPSLAQDGDARNGSSAASEEARAETAKARHRAGVAAYAKGRYRDAIDLFLEANRLRPSAANSFNVARSYEQMSDASNALAWYRDYLRRADGAGDSAQVARHVARLEKRLAQKGVQQVTIDSSPRGATVLIDQNPVGVSPWTGDLAPGLHSVDLTLRGFEDVSQQFDLPPDHALDIELVLAPKRAEEEARPLPVPQSPPVFELQPAPRAPPKPEEGSAFTTLGWVALGSGAAALGTALVFEVLRRGAEEDAQNETRQIQFAQDLETMHSHQTFARVFGGAGATLAVAGGILLLVGSGDDDEGEHAPGGPVALSCAPFPCRAAVTGRF